MNRALLRKYGLYILFPLFCAAIILFILVASERELAATDAKVVRAYQVITEAERLSYLIEGMVAAQRGYIITGNEEFMERFHQRRDNFSGLIGHLNELLQGNQAQISRLSEIRNYFNDYSARLEERAHMFAPAPQLPSKGSFEETEAIDSIRENILGLTETILREEYSSLEDQIEIIENKKQIYFYTLLASIIAATALLMAFNAYFIRTQQRRGWFEKILKRSEERYALAVEGTRDGIFDWDFETGKIFYSAQFFKMLGYESEGYVGKIEDSKNLVHPDDMQRVQDYLNQYLDGKISEYNQEFRMRHKDGSWVWINSRAKAIFDTDGRPLRMVGAHIDITPVKEQEKRLTSEKIEAEAANLAKREFLAHMSHEIRTPLTAISGITEIFENRKDGMDQRQQKLISTLTTSVAVLKSLINDILDFSKIETGELELIEEPFRLASVFTDLESMMVVRAHEKGIEFHIDIQDIKDTVYAGDAERLRQVVGNLISNAIKFTSRGRVIVRAYQEIRGDSPYLRIDVADTGIGIAPENFDLIFDRFKQEDSSISRKYGGTGLGLSIAKNLARLMGGDIVLSSAVGEGSTFSVILPWKEIDGKARGKAYERKGAGKAAAGSGKKILMVEDYEGNVVFLSYILEEMGHRFDVAATGNEAIRLWEKGAYDLILMDIQLPEKDGFAATREIRSLEKEKNIERTPIIGMTAHALVGDREKCLEAGMDAYLPKPIVEQDLKREINRYVTKKRKAA